MIQDAAATATGNGDPWRAKTALPIDNYGGLCYPPDIGAHQALRGD
jgi:hypothetical protein